MNNITIKTLFLICIAIGCFSKTNAKEIYKADSTSLMLSVQKCREMALQSSEDMKIAQYNNEQAINGKHIAKAAALPKVSASGMYAYLNSDITLKLPPANLTFPLMGTEIDLSALIPPSIGMDLNTSAYLFGATVQQPIYAGGRIITGNKMAEKGVEITEENIKLTSISVIAEAEKAYWAYFSVRDKADLLEKYETLLENLHKSVSNMIDAGMTTENELLKITSRESNIQYQKQKAQNGMEVMRMQLCRIIGVNIDTEIVLTDSVSEVKYPSIDLAHDLTIRPEYSILQKQVELKELEIKNVRGSYLPTIGLMAGYTYIGDFNMGGTSMQFDKPLAMGLVSISIPIFNFGEGSRKIQNAKIARDIQKEELNKNSKLLTIEIQYAGRNLIDAFQLIDTSEAALEQAEANLNSVQNKYDVGMGTLIDVLDAQTQWHEAYSNTIDARAQYKIAEVDYSRVTGKL